MSCSIETTMSIFCIPTAVPRTALLRAVMMAALLLTFPKANAQQAAASEAQVKAAFIVNFAKFVEWPSDRSSGPLVICVADRSSDTLQELRRLAESKSVAGRSIQVRSIGGFAESSGCHIVFVPQSTLKQLPPYGGNEILSVGENSAFLENGGILSLVIQNDHVRLQVNPEAAQAAQLKISSKLLAIARVVHTKGAAR
jgi:hypothetical protein